MIVFASNNSNDKEGVGIFWGFKDSIGQFLVLISFSVFALTKCGFSVFMPYAVCRFSPNLSLVFSFVNNDGMPWFFCFAKFRDNAEGGARWL